MNHTETITKTIPFCDVDSTGAVWHGNYVKYFEEARCKLFENLGFSYGTIFHHNYEMPVISVKIKYRRPCKYNQIINVSATLIKSDHLLIVKHEITDFQTNKKLTTAEVQHMTFCRSTQKGLLKLPDFILEKISN